MRRHTYRVGQRRDGWFEVIAGRSTPADGPAKCFGFVQTYDTKPKRRLFEVRAVQGMQANQQVTFLTDGGEDVRDLPWYLNPQAEHLLDWFHVTMRLTVMTQLAKGLPALPGLGEQLARLKWLCWHGNVLRALQTVEDIEFHLDPDDAGPEQRKLCKVVGEFGGYGRRYWQARVIDTVACASTLRLIRPVLVTVCVW